MIARAEFAFLVAVKAQELKAGVMETYPGQPMMRPEVYGAVCYALVCAFVSSPFLFKWALRMYAQSAPVLRADLIGGTGRSGEDFIIKITGQHHTGMLHEVLDTLHSEGLDIVEARAAIAGGSAKSDHIDSDIFIVRPRGKQKDFDNEKLRDIKNALMEMLGHSAGEVSFNPCGSRDSRAALEETIDQGSPVPATKAVLGGIVGSHAQVAPFHAPVEETVEDIENGPAH
jgi:hypothetical protein